MQETRICTVLATYRQLVETKTPGNSRLYYHSLDRKIKEPYHIAVCFIIHNELKSIQLVYMQTRNYYSQQFYKSIFCHLVITWSVFVLYLRNFQQFRKLESMPKFYRELESCKNFTWIPASLQKFCNNKGNSELWLAFLSYTDIMERLQRRFLKYLSFRITGSSSWRN